MSSISQTATEEKIELSVALTTGGRYSARIRKGGRTYSLGKFNSESAAWIACQNKSKEIHRMEDSTPALSNKGLDRLNAAVQSRNSISTEIERGEQWNAQLEYFVGKEDAASIYMDADKQAEILNLVEGIVVYQLPSGRVLMMSDGSTYGPSRSDKLRLWSNPMDWKAEIQAEAEAKAKATEDPERFDEFTGAAGRFVLDQQAMAKTL